MKIYDIIIIGGGPAGLTAGIYAGRAMMDTLILEKASAGGLMAVTDKLENWPGHESITGADLSETMLKQALNFGCELKSEEVLNMEKSEGLFKVKTFENEYTARTIIYSAGTVPKQLDVPGEREFLGKGVSYCATCDAPFYRDMRVAVVGGGDSSLKEAIYLTKFAKEVVVIHRRQGLRAEKIIQKKAKENKKISFMLDSIVKEIKGTNFVEKISIENVKTSDVSEHPFDGVFVFIGYSPENKLIKEFANLSKRGRVITESDMSTKTPGLFAAGDIREKSVNQVSTAVGDGATSAVSAEHYISSLS